MKSSRKKIFNDAVFFSVEDENKNEKLEFNKISFNLRNFVQT